MRTSPGCLVSAALVFAIASTTGHPAAPIPHPSGASEIVLHVTTSGGVDTSVGSVTVRGDGEVVIQAGLSRRHASPEPPVLGVGEEGVQHTVQTARAAGLLDGTKFGSSHLTDRDVTVIEIQANHQRRVISVRAGLDPAGAGA